MIDNLITLVSFFTSGGNLLLALILKKHEMASERKALREKIPEINGEI